MTTEQIDTEYKNALELTKRIFHPDTWKLLMDPSKDIRARRRICSGCTFWRKEPESTDEGYCQRYAPRPAEKGAPTRWQLTMATDWCGDFQEKTT